MYIPKSGPQNLCASSLVTDPNSIKKTTTPLTCEYRKNAIRLWFIKAEVNSCCLHSVYLNKTFIFIYLLIKNIYFFFVDEIKF